jgi:hypothetical protein
LTIKFTQSTSAASGRVFSSQYLAFGQIPMTNHQIAELVL